MDDNIVHSVVVSYSIWLNMVLMVDWRRREEEVETNNHYIYMHINIPTLSTV